MRLVVLDTETTGTEPEVDRLVELACLSVDLNGPELLIDRGDGLNPWRFEALCNPGRDIPPGAKAVHHITESMVAGEPDPHEVVSEMLAEVGEVNYWVAHNAEFDRGFMRRFSPYFDDPSGWICTYRCALHLWPDAPGFSNQTLRYWLDLSPDVPKGLAPHRAMYDIIVTEGILARMLETHTPQQLAELGPRPALLQTCRFGKHRGTPWRDVPRDYMRWYLKQTEQDKDVKHTCLHWLGAQTSML